MLIEGGSMADAPSFTLTQSGTFAKEDFVINKSGIAAVNGEASRDPGFRLADLEMLEVLGRGASSLVRRAIHRPSGRAVAVKILSVFEKSKRDQLVRELRTLYQFSRSGSSALFPWLVAFHDCLYDEGAMYIVLECAAPPRRPRSRLLFTPRSAAGLLSAPQVHGRWLAGRPAADGAAHLRISRVV
jgi:hypothetical protein